MGCARVGLRRLLWICYTEDGGGNMRIEYTKTAAKALARMDRNMRLRIRAGIEGLTENPPRGDIKPMQGLPQGRYRLRIGSYRVIYSFRRDGMVEILCILDIGSRGDIYK